MVYFKDGIYRFIIKDFQQLFSHIVSAIFKASVDPFDDHAQYRICLVTGGEFFIDLRVRPVIFQVLHPGIMDGMEPAGDIEDAKWDRIFAINTTSVMRSTRKVMPIFLEKQKGVIINIASAGGLYGARAGAAYTASIHAVVGFTKNTGYMYANRGIRCNAIAPGGVETNIGSSMTNINEFGFSRQQLGMAINPRNGKPEEIAKVALFLASDDSSFVNGTVITADAGWSAY